MTVPRAICIDTCVLDAQNYNYASSAMSSFAAAVGNAGVTLLLPDPIEREVQRHITERANDALRALREAGHRAPFLRKWNAWPIREDRPFESWTLSSIAMMEWRQFLKNFKVERLAYDGVDISEVMTWYENGVSPFETPGKRAEFPDALAVAIVVAYARAQAVPVAVISQDAGVCRACERFPSLLAFKSLPAFTEVWLTEDARLDGARAAFAASEAIIKGELASEFQQLGFIVEHAPLDVEGVEVTGIELQDVNVVAIGEQDCTAVFSALITFIVRCRAYDPDSGYPCGEYAFEDEHEVTGSVKLDLTLDDGGMHIVSVLSIDGDDADVAIRTGYHDPYDYCEPDDWRT